MNTTLHIPNDTQLILVLLGPHWVKVPPLALVYLENYLTQNGCKVTILDLNILFFRLLQASKKTWLTAHADFETNLFSHMKQSFPQLIEQIMNGIAHSNAQIIGFSLFSRNRTATFTFANEIRHAAQSKIFVFGGPEVLFEYHKESFFDEVNTDNTYFVLGEGERALLEICKNVYRNRNAPLIIHKDKQLIMYNEIAELDTLPMPNFDTIDMQLYDTNTIPLFSSRGCIRSCSFCSEHRLYKHFRQHSPEYMLTAIKTLKRKYKKHTFSFHDSLINANRAWLDRFCELLIQETLDIQWEAQFAIRRDMKIKLGEKMKAAGCYNLFIGLESASDRILTEMKKGYTSETAREFFQMLNAAGLHYEVSIITGFPQETEEDFQKTLQFIQCNKHYIPKIAQVNAFVEYAPSRINFQNPQCKEVASERVERLLAMFKENNIRYTASFINNLIPA